MGCGVVERHLEMAQPTTKKRVESMKAAILKVTKLELTELKPKFEYDNNLESKNESHKPWSSKNKIFFTFARSYIF